MSRERFRRVAAFWNWLPAFRAVAEHQSIHGAAQALGVSPSALSRTVRLLEDALDTELFVRGGAGLTLTPWGTELLSSTRSAMRIIDDCVEARATMVAERMVFVGVTSSVASATLAHALLEHQPHEPRVILDVRTVTEDALDDMLLRGDLDLAVTTKATAVAELTIGRIGEASYAVYAAQGHELAPRAGELTVQDLAKARFVTPRGGDGWPMDEPRSAPIITDSVEMGLVLCQNGGFLCVLPKLVRVPHFVRLCELPPIVLYVLRRKALPGQDTALLDGLVVSLRQALREQAERHFFGTK
jgi:DNA-binding transcriptional LysR family regulator